MHIYPQNTVFNALFNLGYGLFLFSLTLNHFLAFLKTAFLIYRLVLVFNSSVQVFSFCFVFFFFNLEISLLIYLLYYWFFFFFCLWDRFLLCNPNQFETYCVSQTGLKLM